MSLRIGVVGGGPSGLYFAILMKKRNPASHVVVFEQNPESATYGFGVVVAGGALERIGQHDPETFEEFARHAEFLRNQRIMLNGQAVLIDNPYPGASIERLKLLQILHERCRAVGIRVEFDHRVENLEDMDGYDLIVGADGGNSAVRAWRDAEFGVETRSLTNRFSWFGAPVPFDTPTLCFKTAPHGVFVGHYYRYTPTMGTFVAECDAATWSNGFGDLTDAARKAAIEQLFADELQGQRLIENRSIWRCFQGVKTQKWSSGNIVLIGDALRTMHFSVGSGTRQAMEDSVALYEAMVACEDDVAAALAAFEAQRRPEAVKLERASERSFEWYESIRAHMCGDVIDFAYDYMTRTGRISDDRLRRAFPNFMAQYDARVRGSAESII